MYYFNKKSDLNFKAPISYESWIHRCDDYRFLTILPNEAKSNQEYNYKYSLDATISVDHSNLKQIQFRQKFKYIKLLQPPGFLNDAYKNLTNKIYLSYKFIYEKYPNFKWYLKCDDDTFMHMNNLKKFLSEKNSSHAVSYGRIVSPEPNRNLMKENMNGFLSGGAGYVLSNEG